MHRESGLFFCGCVFGARSQGGSSTIYRSRARHPALFCLSSRLSPLIVRIWLFRAKERATATNHEKAEQAKYHAIDILFAWLKALSKSPILPLFVFDGPGRPAFKRNKVISGRVWTGPVETAFTLLIEKTFGWQHWTVSQALDKETD